MTDLDAVLGRAVGIFEALGIRYALVGGLAVSAWAVPRSTRDVDFWVDLEAKESGNLKDSLELAGFDVPAMEEELQRFGVFRSKDRVSGVFVDIFDATGPLGASLLDRRRCGKLGDLELWLCSPEDLALLKAFSDRARDFEDLVALLSQGDVDCEYLESWAQRLDASIGTDEVSERVRHALELAHQHQQ